MTLSTQLQELGLNKNEAKVYLALVRLGEAVASQIVKKIGVHRNIVYDNLEKLKEKGLVSVIIKEGKKTFIAQDSGALLEYVDDCRTQVEEKAMVAEKVAPEIAKILGATAQKQTAHLYQGVKGVKKVLNQVLQSGEYWDIGVTNASVDLLGETWWRNFNVKVRKLKVREHLLLNSDFEKKVGIESSPRRKFRTLPKSLTQATEIMLFDQKVAIFVYSETPTVVVLDDAHVFSSFQMHFSFLWNSTKK